MKWPATTLCPILLLVTACAVEPTLKADHDAPETYPYYSPEEHGELLPSEGIQLEPKKGLPPPKYE